MPGEVGGVSEMLVTSVTHIRPLSFVHALVGLEVMCLEEGLGADGTGMAPLAYVVAANVYLRAVQLHCQIWT